MGIPARVMERLAMKPPFPLSMLLLVLFTGPFAYCGEIEELHRHAKPSPDRTDASRRTNEETDALHSPGVSEIGLERTLCYGDCPVYTVIIKSDGTFRYHGENHVKRKGEHTGKVTPTAFNRLAQFIHDSGFANMQHAYSRGVFDSATVYTTAVIDGKRKVISNYDNAGPTTLWAIEQLIDKLLLEAEWDGKPAEAAPKP
jgi:hypothetical protein